MRTRIIVRTNLISEEDRARIEMASRKGEK
jgi:hypothetical protein